MSVQVPAGSAASSGAGVVLVVSALVMICLMVRGQAGRRRHQRSVRPLRSCETASKVTRSRHGRNTYWHQR